MSSQTTRVLAAMAADPSRWYHGYELLGVTGLKSGSLYPILIRLSDQGWLETAWEHDTPPGRPRRHLYRLSGEARSFVATMGHNRSSAPRARLIARMAP
jgi:DNA-binding PadR family transcriptional regulator